jgi:hypothetical protein
VSPGGDRHETGLRTLEALAGPDAAAREIVLGSSPVIAFVATTDPRRAKACYAGTLCGLTLSLTEFNG